MKKNLYLVKCYFNSLKKLAMYNEIMNESLKASNNLVNNLSEKDLDALMSEFDNYEVDYVSDSFSEKSFSECLNRSYKKFRDKLFEEFDLQKRESVTVSEKIISKNPSRVLFLF